MAKVSAQGAITGANLTDGDLFYIVDISDTTDGAGGTGKIVTRAELFSSLFDNIDINGGEIDGAVVGGTTPAAGTFSSLTATTSDINGGTIDATIIGGTTPAAGTFTSLNATGGGSLTGTWSDLGTVTTVDINGGTIDGTVVGGATPAAGTFNDLTAGRVIVGTNSVGTTTDIELSGNSIISSPDSLRFGVESGGEFIFYIGVTSASGGTAGGTEAVTINSNSSVDFAGNIKIDNNQPIFDLVESDGTSTHNGARIRLESDVFAMQTRDSSGVFVSQDYMITKGSSGATGHEWRIENDNVMSIDSGGALLVGKSSASIFTDGFEVREYGLVAISRDSGQPLSINRNGSDGTLINFYQDGTSEGSIIVGGTDVSLSGAHLSRWSQWEGASVSDTPKRGRPDVLRGTVLSNVSEMCEWFAVEWTEILPAEEDNLPLDQKESVKHHILYDGIGSVGDVVDYTTESGEVVRATIVQEDNDQLNRMVISNTEGDRGVAGVFQGYDFDDDTAPFDFYNAMTGDFVIRIAHGVEVEKDDLLMSAGDGTAKPQIDDLVRSSTVAKVTSLHVVETYADGSYTVPCVLMAC